MVSNDNRRHQKERGTDLKGCGESARSWQGDFPGGLVAKTPNSLCRGLSSISGQGTRFHLLKLKKIPHTASRDPACCNEDPVQSNK